MEYASPTARDRYDALVAVASDSGVALDFDGVLAPIVEDPRQAHVHPAIPELLVRLAAEVRAVAIVTGRPARQVIRLGNLDWVGGQVSELGRTLHIFGQYGNERWSSATRELQEPQPPAGLAALRHELPELLTSLDAGDAYVEDKRLAVAVHTRRLADATEAFDRLLEPMRELAHRHGLAIEPGRYVVEVRSGDVDKGRAVDTLVAELQLSGLLFAGDDLGDVPAFAAAERQRREHGLSTLLVCAASGEQRALLDRADVLVPGPDGVRSFLEDFLRDVRR